MTPHTFLIFVELNVVRFHLGFTFRRLRYNPYTKDLSITGVFESLLAECALMQQKEVELDDQIDDREVEIVAVDLDLNAFAQSVSREVLRLTKGNREDALYKHYFGDKPLHVFTRPTMGDQYIAMTTWPSSLGSSPQPTLTALAPEAKVLLEKAEKVIKAKGDAEQERSKFREVGERKDYIDRVNAARKEAYGILSTLPHKHVGLPLNFADQFFKRERPKNGEKVTIEGLEEDLAELKEEVAQKEALLLSMKSAEEKAAKEAEEAAAAREQAKAKLAELRKDLAAKEKQAEELAAVIRANS